MPNTEMEATAETAPSAAMPNQAQLLQAIAQQFGITSQADLQTAIQMLAQNPQMLQQILQQLGMGEGNEQGGAGWMDQAAAKQANLRPAAPPLPNDDEEEPEEEEPEDVT